MLETEVAHQDLQISKDEFLIAHGKSSFLKPERIQKMLREHAGTGRWWSNRFQFKMKMTLAQELYMAGLTS